MVAVPNFSTGGGGCWVVWVVCVVCVVWVVCVVGAVVWVVGFSAWVGAVVSPLSKPEGPNSATAPTIKDSTTARQTMRLISVFLEAIRFLLPYQGLSK